MSQVISFADYTPPARFDAVPWAQVRIEEGPTPEGAWTTIDTLALDPLDADPSIPQTRSFTTSNGSDTDGLWYRVTFIDGANATSQPSTPVQNIAASTRDLCTLADVKAYIPAYVSDAETDSKLVQLITAQSQLILSETGREIIVDADTETRIFPIDKRASWRRQVDIGDLASKDDLTLRLLARDRTLAATIDIDTEVLYLYDGLQEFQTEEWEPIVRLEFPLALGGPTMLLGQALEVTGHFGFPEIPAFIREACAGRVILRYLNDVANAGTAFSDAIENVNLDELFRSSEDALAQFQQVVVA